MSLVLISCKSEKHSMEQLRDKFGHIKVTNAHEASLAYPRTPQEIEKRTEDSIKNIQKIVDDIIAVPANQQNKHTMIYAFDCLDGYTFELGIFEFIQNGFPDEKMRESASEASTKLRDFITDHVDMNVHLYEAFKKYYEGNAATEDLLPEERYFLDELMKDFKRSGLNLPEAERLKVVELSKKMNQIGQDFSRNISEDSTTVSVKKEELAGVSDEFIAGMTKDDTGLYVLHTDYPTQTMISNYCTVQETRKKFSKAFGNRAYPKNKEVLDQLIQVRDELAKVLGFESYAALDLDDQMIKTAAHAWEFEHDLEKRAIEKAQQEFNMLTAELPEGVALSPEGKMYPWDGGYISTYFKKQKYDIDERVLAEYFPMEKTVDGLMHIYQQFFSIIIEYAQPSYTWHPDVKLLKISDANTKQILGYVFLDMYPRPKKYGHAAQFSGITAYKAQDGSYYPGVVTVVCNFTKSTETKPSLLKYNEVQTFFHEFGHALHSILGGTRLACQAGTNVKSDFVELPSQMLESWLEDKEIVKNLSCHYQTGEKMPDVLLDKKLELLKFGVGMQTVGQVTYGMLCLDYYGPGAHKDTDAIRMQYVERLMPYAVIDKDTHMQCSFGHLVGYAAKYYGYMWSDVLGQDVFAQIEKVGLLNPVVGKKYVDCILGKGGSKDPNELLVDFLGRQPNSDAFFKKMGL